MFLLQMLGIPSQDPKFQFPAFFPASGEDQISQLNDFIFFLQKKKIHAHE